MRRAAPVALACLLLAGLARADERSGPVADDLPTARAARAVDAVEAAAGDVRRAAAELAEVLGRSSAAGRPAWLAEAIEADLRLQREVARLERAMAELEALREELPERAMPVGSGP